jgi:hypothetical protein
MPINLTPTPPSGMAYNTSAGLGAASFCVSYGVASRLHFGEIAETATPHRIINQAGVRGVRLG